LASIENSMKPVPIDRGCPDIFDTPVKRLAPLPADHVPQQAAQIAYVGILLDDGGFSQIISPQ
jgi:hypothetical protein